MKNFIIRKDHYYSNRTNYGPFLIVFIVLLFIVIFIILNNKNKTTSYEPTTKDSENITNTSSNTDKDKKENSKIVIAEQTPPEIYPVTKVVDGDTLWVDINGVNTKIRLIGVNTPETVSPSKPVECYGPEASNYTKSMLDGKYVGLEADSSQGDVDIYGRALRYVYINHQNFNFLLIANGYGFEYTFNTPYKYQSNFKSIEVEAKTNLRGLWSPENCSY